MLPAVIFVGPTKCGTTWIDTYLREREEVVLPADCKETFFFDKAFNKGTAWYEAHFQGSEGVGVEVAPSLFHKPHAIANVKATCPGAKIIIVFRDPYDRAISHYFHYRKQGAPKMPITQMAETHPDMIEAGLFNKYAQKWEEAFPGQVTFLSYEMLKTDPVRFCRDVCQQLGIPDDVPPPASLSSRSVNAASLPRSRKLAHYTRRGAEIVRRLGGHKLVNFLRQTGLKKLAFSGGNDVGTERMEIRAEVLALAPAIGDDLDAFQKNYGARLPQAT